MHSCNAYNNKIIENGIYFVYASLHCTYIDVEEREQS